MTALLQTEEKFVVLGGDGRCDSPGFCAKYGAYSFMELEYNVLLHVELVQVSCLC
jgi:solute carrier family 8 (sodium/calcium exchanger)